MNAVDRKGREFWVILILLALFLGVAYYAEQAGQAVVDRASSSTLNASPEGSKALYALFSALPYTARRLTAPWNSLTDQDGLLIVVEKLDKTRPITPAEISAARQWVERGGTVLYFVQEPARPLDPKDTLAGDVAIVRSDEPTGQAATPSISSPYTWQVNAISTEGKVRLLPAPGSPFQPLFADQNGIVAIHKPLGRGHVLVVADAPLISNKGIGEADNVVFLVNVAQAATGGRAKAILFDEYHHGVGFDAAQDGQQTWISTLPRPLKLAAFPLAALILLLIYNGNQRFGSPRSLPLPAYRPSTEYVVSLARWYQRAGAADLAIQALYTDFRRDITGFMELPLDAPGVDIEERARRLYPGEAGPLSQIITDCERILAAKRAAPQELLNLSRRMEQCKRRIHLAGTL